MRRRRLFGLAAGAAVAPVAAVAAPVVEMHPNDVAPEQVVFGPFPEPDFLRRYRAEFIAGFEARTESIRPGDIVIIPGGRPFVVTETFTAEGKDDA